MKRDGEQQRQVEKNDCANLVTTFEDSSPDVRPWRKPLGDRRDCRDSEHSGNLPENV